MNPRSFKMTYNFLVFPVRTLIFCLQLFNFFSLVTFPLSSSALVFWFLYINTMIDVTFFFALNIFPFTAYNCWKLILFSAFDWKNPSTRLFSLSNFSLLIFSLLLTCLLKRIGRYQFTFKMVHYISLGVGQLTVPQGYQRGRRHTSR